MIKGLVARHFIISFPLVRDSEPFTNFLVFRGRSPTLPKGKTYKVRFYVLSFIIEQTHVGKNILTYHEFE